MEELEKKLFVYRRSYKYYNHVSNSLLLSKFVFSAAGLSAFIMLPLASLSLGSVIIELIEKHLNIADRKAEYRTTYNFYNELLSLLKCGQLTVEEVIQRETEMRKTFRFFPREKYMKQVRLNGYKYCKNNSIINQEKLPKV